MEKITKKMKIEEVLKKHPETLEVFNKYGFHCIGCAISHFESLEEAAEAHRIDINELVEELNKSIRNT